MSEDCQKCGTAMYDLDKDRNCPGCSDFPVPPAGDVEAVCEVVDEKYNRVQFYRQTGDTSKPYHRPGEKLYDQACVTRLTAERDGLHEDFYLLLQECDNAKRNASAFEERMGELQVSEGRLQSELTKARELIEHLSIALGELDSTLRVVAVAGSKTSLSSLRTLAKRSLSIAHGLLSDQTAPATDESCGQDAVAAKGGQS